MKQKGTEEKRVNNHEIARSFRNNEKLSNEKKAVIDTHLKAIPISESYSTMDILHTEIGTLTVARLQPTHRMRKITR